MIEFNLIPDVKINFLKARRLKRLVIGISVTVSAVSFTIFLLLLLFVKVVQGVAIHSLNNKIASNTKILQDNKNLNDVLTIQNQLNTLSSIENADPNPNYLAGYLAELLPSKATISDLQVSFSGNTVAMTGNANNLVTVNKLVDTLKFTNFTLNSKNEGSAFSGVTLSAFSVNQSNTGTQAQYTINFNFNPQIFQSFANIKLNVPKETTTRSVLDQPPPLFFKSKTTNSQTQG